jgi:proteasome accessory factor C
MSAKRGPRKTEERLKRLLVMLPWLMEHSPAPLIEMAARFELTTQALVADLELAAMCGLPPYLDEVIDVYLDDGMVHIGVPRFFVRPLRLTAPEGFALLTAGRAAMALPGADTAGPLGRALDKLALALGGDSVVVELERPVFADALAEACAAGTRLEIEYWSPARDEATTRAVSPRAVFSDAGHWYLVADDSRSQQERTFRIDRVLSIEPTGVVDAPRAVTLPDPQRWFSDEPEMSRVELHVRADRFWMIERYPLDQVTREGDTITVSLPVSSEQWLARLLLRLGGAAMVVSPERWTTLAATVANDVLRQYELMTA